MATKFEVLLSAKLDSNSVNDIQKQLDSISKGTKFINTKEARNKLNSYFRN